MRFELVPMRSFALNCRFHYDHNFGLTLDHLSLL
jgi:hypothetical protein